MSIEFRDPNVQEEYDHLLYREGVLSDELAEVEQRLRQIEETEERL